MDSVTNVNELFELAKDLPNMKTREYRMKHVHDFKTGIFKFLQ